MILRRHFNHIRLARFDIGQWRAERKGKSIEGVIKTRDKEVCASQPAPWLLALSSPLMYERGLGGNDSFNWIWCTAFDSYNCFHANGEYVLTSDLFILFLTSTTAHYVWLRGRTLVDCIMVDRGADWHRAHLSGIPNDSSYEYHPPRKSTFFSNWNCWAQTSEGELDIWRN